MKSLINRLSEVSSLEEAYDYSNLDRIAKRSIDAVKRLGEAYKVVIGKPSRSDSYGFDPEGKIAVEVEISTNLVATDDETSEFRIIFSEDPDGEMSVGIYEDRYQNEIEKSFSTKSGIPKWVRSTVKKEFAPQIASKADLLRMHGRVIKSWERAK